MLPGLKLQRGVSNLKSAAKQGIHLHNHTLLVAVFSNAKVGGEGRALAREAPDMHVVNVEHLWQLANRHLNLMNLNSGGNGLQQNMN